MPLPANLLRENIVFGIILKSAPHFEKKKKSHSGYIVHIRLTHCLDY